MRFGSTAKVLLKCKLKYYRISECGASLPARFGQKISTMSGEGGGLVQSLLLALVLVPVVTFGQEKLGAFLCKEPVPWQMQRSDRLALELSRIAGSQVRYGFDPLLLLQASSIRLYFVASSSLFACRTASRC